MSANLALAAMSILVLQLNLDIAAAQTRRTLVPGENCRRNCGGPALICQFKFHVERYSTLGAACRACRDGTLADCELPQCVAVDGGERSFIAVNRQMPSPPIEVCQNDEIIVDVENAMPDETTTIHWHGVRQLGTQINDGVPMVTQCPIDPGQTFRYRFLAQAAGTFFYHSHTGIQKLDGLSGPLVVRRQPGNVDPNHRLDAERLPEYILFVQDWTAIPGESMVPGFDNPSFNQLPSTYLVNGRGLTPAGRKRVPITEFIVDPGQRYRFRLIGATCMTCTVAVQFQSHRVQAFSADGGLLFSPVTVDTVFMNSADRFDVILEANQTPGVYYIFIENKNRFCPGIRNVAILRYRGQTRELPFPAPNPNYGVSLNDPNSTCSRPDPNQICVSQLRGQLNAPSNSANGVRWHLPVSFNNYVYSANELFQPDIYERFEEPVRPRLVSYLLNNVSFTFPSSPMISQSRDIPADRLCTPECRGRVRVKPCYCANVESVPRNALIDVVVYDAGPDGDFFHPFHLHGYDFFVLEAGVFRTNNVEAEVRALRDRMGRNDVNLVNRPQRDTISVPAKGYVLIRFLADNPGYWLVHCHFVFHLESGMALVVKVGEDRDIPAIPSNFPRCGNYLPPI